MAASLFRLAFFVALVLPQTSALSSNYYSKSCPKLFQVVIPIMDKAIRRMLELGCDGSLLLDDTPTFTGEKTTPRNVNIRGFDVIDDIKTAVEMECPGIVSCADILAIASQVSVRKLRGPIWHLMLGRLDARTANKDLADANLPSFSLNLGGLDRSYI